MKKIFQAKICVPAPLVATSVLTQNKGPGTEAHFWNPPPPPSPGTHAIPLPQSNFRAALVQPTDMREKLNMELFCKFGKVKVTVPSPPPPLTIQGCSLFKRRGGGGASCAVCG